jgi:hypothetical protein
MPWLLHFSITPAIASAVMATIGTSLLISRDLVGSRVSVHDRHMQIHQDQIDPGAVFGIEPPSFFSVGSDLNSKSPPVPECSSR